MRILREGNVPRISKETSVLMMSRYNVLINEHNGLFTYFNTLSGAVVEITNTELEAIREKRCYDLELYKNGFLIPVDFNEVDWVKQYFRKSRLVAKTNMVVIAPTTFCNMACPYCFENGFIENSNMNSNLVKDIITFIEQNYCDKNLTVIWYGGEPLLRMDVIRTISESLVQICKKKNIEYTAGMITNGYLLSEKIIDELVNECKVKLLQISLDGKDSVNNERRKLRSGEASYNRILSNIILAHKKMKISLRINVDLGNIQSTKELLKEVLLNPSIDHKQLVPYVAPITKVHKDMSYPLAMDRKQFAEIFLKEFMEIFIEGRNIEKVIDEGEYFFDQCCALERRAWRGLFPYSLTCPCGVLSKSQITIDSEGKLYKCWDTIGVNTHCIGSIYDEHINDKASNSWHQYELPDQCLMCEYLPICMGGCVREGIANKKPSCPYDLDIYKEIIKQIYV